MMKTFSIGGIHPSDSKISKDCKIEVLPVPSKVFISVAQHLGAPATPIVKAGDQVKVGQVIAEPAGFFMVPEGWEYIGDVMNVLFTNGWIVDEDGKVFIYYASSDTRMHVATSTVDRLVDYCMNTEPDALTTGESVKRLNRLIDRNLMR